MLYLDQLIADLLEVDKQNVYLKMVHSRCPVWILTLYHKSQYDMSDAISAISGLCYRLNCSCVLGVHVSWAHSHHAHMVLLKELVLEGWAV